MCWQFLFLLSPSAEHRHLWLTRVCCKYFENKNRLCWENLWRSKSVPHFYTFNDKLLVADLHFPSFTFSRLNRRRLLLASYCFKLITRLIYALLTWLPSLNTGLKRRFKSRLWEQFWLWWALLKQRATRTQDVDSTNLYSTKQQNAYLMWQDMILTKRNVVFETSTFLNILKLITL